MDRSNKNHQQRNDGTTGRDSEGAAACSQSSTKELHRKRSETRIDSCKDKQVANSGFLDDRCNVRNGSNAGPRLTPTAGKMTSNLTMIPGCGRPPPGKARLKIFEFDRAIVRQPAASVVHGLRTHGRDDPSFEGVAREHAAYTEALSRAGLVVTPLPPLPDYPDSVFVEDPALVFPEGAILLRPGTPTRANEAAELRCSLSEMFDVVHELPEGHADGGDVLVTPHKVFIGISDRTDEAGAAALVRLLAGFGLHGEIVETPEEVLHLKTAASLVDEETILTTEALAATGIFAGFRLLTVPAGEEGGANVLRVNDTLLAVAEFPRTLAMLLPYVPNLVTLEIREVAKIDAGLTCMSLRWKSTCTSAGSAR